uniref:Putative secreted protein n=1 Tax=Amblyomma aureolatum TaxID=187763 RepID=A0A1E1XD12_9ACAR
MHLLLLMAIVLVALVVVSLAVCFCYGLDTASCMAAFKLNSAAHSVAGLYNGYADAGANGVRSNGSSSAVAAPSERPSCPAEQGSSYSSTIELYDSTWQIKEPAPPRPPCRVMASAHHAQGGDRNCEAPRWYVGDILEGDIVHGQVTLEKLDSGCSSSSMLFLEARDNRNGVLPCARFAGAAVSLPSVLKGGNWNRRHSCSPYTDLDTADSFRLEMRSCSLLEESSCGRQVSPIGS